MIINQSKMKSRFFLSACLALIASLAITAAQKNEEWKKIENDHFSFSIPATFKKTNSRGTDSFVEEYVDEGIKLIFDYGLYSNNFDDWPQETKFYPIKIGDEDVRVGTVKYEFHRGYPFSTQVYIKAGKQHQNLSMFAACKTQEKVELAQKIFPTIVFKTKKN